MRERTAGPEGIEGAPGQEPARPARRWYRLGLLPILAGVAWFLVRTLSAFGLYRTLRLYAPLVGPGTLIPDADTGRYLGSMIPENALNAQGKITYLPVYLQLGEGALGLLAGLAVGAAIFLLGRRKWWGTSGRR